MSDNICRCAAEESQICKDTFMRLLHPVSCSPWHDHFPRLLRPAAGLLPDRDTHSILSSLSPTDCFPSLPLPYPNSVYVPLPRLASLNGSECDWRQLSVKRLKVMMIDVTRYLLLKWKPWIQPENWRRSDALPSTSLHLNDFTTDKNCRVFDLTVPQMATAGSHATASTVSDWDTVSENQTNKMFQS